VDRSAAAFWFDVTKADWRATMILGVPAGNVTDRLAMWVWDARQQFGVIGLALAGFGAIALWWRSRPWAVLVWSAYLVNTIFALTYNVGDTHVFFLPGHFFTALAAGVGAAEIVQRGGALAVAWRPRLAVGARALAAAALLAFAAWRGWETWPATDRHDDRRGEQLTSRLLVGVANEQAVLVARLNWDQENALLYAGRYLEPSAPWVRLYDVMPHFAYLVRDNFAIGRDIILTADAATRVAGAYGQQFPIVQDPTPAAPALSAVASDIRRGTPYVLTLLSPLRDYHYDTDDIGAAVQALTGRDNRTGQTYEVFAGVAGEAPLLHAGSATPFVRDLSIAGDDFRIRMDAWLPTDTFRRGSFGHVLRDRHRVLFIERGASLTWIAGDGTAHVAYAGGLYAPQPRFRIPAPTSRLASK
jgi:hypothetical protein